MYQQQYQYPNQFGGFQNHMIEPPMPNGKNKNNGGGFWLGFFGGIITAILIGVAVEVFRRMKQTKNTNETPLPSTPKVEIEAQKPSIVKTIKQEVPNNIFEVSKPFLKQTSDEFLEFLESIGFSLDEDSSDVLGKEIFSNEKGEEIHISGFDVIFKGVEKNPMTLLKKDTLLVSTNTIIQNYFNDEK